MIQCAYRQYRARCHFSSLCAFAWEEYERSLNTENNLNTLSINTMTTQGSMLDPNSSPVMADQDIEDENYAYEEIDPVMLEACSWVRHGRKLQITDLLGGSFEPDVSVLFYFPKLVIYCLNYILFFCIVVVKTRGIGGRTLMMEAAINNRKQIMKLLDSFGADINLCDERHGRTALHYAYFYGYNQLGEYMVAKLGADPSVVDFKNRTCYDMLLLKGVASP